MDHRKQQLEKWKEEKQKKKKEAASQKKKPFIAGVSHVPLKFVPPPPVPVKSSTSGRVTTFQSAQNSNPVHEKQMSQLSAPKNASFKHPQKNIPKVPYVSMVALKQINNKSAFTYDPVLPKRTQEIVGEVKPTRYRLQNKLVDSKVSRTKANNVKPKDKTTKPVLKMNTKIFQSSSSSETDSIVSMRLRTRKAMPALRSLVVQSSTETDSSSQSAILENKDHQSPPHPKSRRSHPDSPILKSKTPRKSTPKDAIDAKQYTPKNKVPKTESSSEEKLDFPKSPLDLLDEDTSDIDNIDHFRRQLASEIKRMTEMCETWDRILEQTVLPVSIQECILGAVGQARLLMSQKLQQLASLVERCARPDPSAALVTQTDLLGFWDVVYIQVENVNMRFKKLEQKRARGWVEEQTVAFAKKVKPVKVPKTKPVGGASRIKDIIAAARRGKKEQAPAVPEKTFEADFFCVKTPVRFPACVCGPSEPHTPVGNPNLLEAVLSSEAKNYIPFAMLRASVLGKSFDWEGVAPLPQTPLSQNQLNATPARSLLKQASNTAKKSANKSINVELFDRSDAEVTPEKPIELEPAVPELNVDSGLSSMDAEIEEKENSRKKSHRLVRQDATDDRSATPQDTQERPLCRLTGLIASLRSWNM